MPINNCVLTDIVLQDLSLGHLDFSTQSKYAHVCESLCSFGQRGFARRTSLYHQGAA